MGLVCCKDCRNSEDDGDDDRRPSTGNKNNNQKRDLFLPYGGTDISSILSVGEENCNIGEVRYHPTITSNNRVVVPEILCSLERNDDTTTRVPQNVLFLIEIPFFQPRHPQENDDDNEINNGEREDIVICWVHPTGKLYHYYTFPNTKTNASDNNIDTNKISHHEHSSSGEAFVIYKSYSRGTKNSSNDNNSKKQNTRPSTVKELMDGAASKNYNKNITNEEDGEYTGYVILCSYRLSLTNTVDTDTELHQLNLVIQSSSSTKTASSRTIANYDDSYTIQVNVLKSHAPDHEYRIIIRHPYVENINYKYHTPLPPYTESWKVKYIFLCPPLPSSSKLSNFNKIYHTFYVWGDLDFAEYGPHARNNKKVDTPTTIQKRQSLYPCQMNQIVPQIMIGRCLSSSDDVTYDPKWEEFDEWVLQSQYYWQTDLGETDGSKAICGKLITGIQPNDIIGTTIHYDSNTGKMYVSISVLTETNPDDPNNNDNVTYFDEEQKKYTVNKEKLSEIVIDRPFPHDPTLFKDWKDFFHQCQQIEEQDDNMNEEESKNENEDKKHGHLRGSNKQADDNTTDNTRQNNNRSMIKGPLARPALNVEYKGSVDVETLKAVCPFNIVDIQYPTAAKENDGERSTISTCQWKTELFCPRLGHVNKLGDLHLRDSVILDGVYGGVPMKRVEDTFVKK